MFDGLHVVITGGSSGLGLALARALAREGASLTLIARDSEKLAAAISTVQEGAPGARVHAAVADVADAQSVNVAVERCARAFGRIDILINNAGVMCEGRFDSVTTAAFREVMQTNFFGVEAVTRAALPYLKVSGGHLVNVASVAGLSGVVGFAAYASAKHALVGLTECLSYELEPEGVKVHLVCPPEFDSAMVRELDRNRSAENRRHVATIPRVDVDVVVHSVLRGVRRGQYLIVPGFFTKLAVLGMRCFPRLNRWIGRKRVALGKA